VSRGGDGAAGPVGGGAGACSHGAGADDAAQCFPLQSPASEPGGGPWLIAPEDLAAWRQGAAPIPGPVDPAALYRLAEAAKLVGVMKQAVHPALRVGRLPAVATTEGRRVRGFDVLADLVGAVARAG
jgi:hypothetical protein